MAFFNLLHKSKDNFQSKNIKPILLQRIQSNAPAANFKKKTESKNIMLALCIGYLLAYLGKKAHLCTGSLKWFSFESNSTEYISSRVLPRFFDQVGHHTTIASFSLNNVRLTKIMNRAAKNWACF